jgi:diaminohydroxyphosphoribosylaminopyrimidine deaminase/5-amino-6-(5-phosphoribosylamino)uracil reductase
MKPRPWPESDLNFMRVALRLARRAFGQTSPNPMVGAVLVKAGQIIGQGWHRRAGGAHAEIEALRDAQSKRRDPTGATLYVTLEPCSTQGRTPPCTVAIRAAGICRVVVAAKDPNPKHAGRAYPLLERTGIQVARGLLAAEADRLNEAFNHWIVHGTPFVTVKAAMTLDGKIATPSGESQWITSETSRAWAMKYRQGADAILVGVNTVLADDPSLTIRLRRSVAGAPKLSGKLLRRIILDSKARTPLDAKLVSGELAGCTTVVVTEAAAQKRILRLSKRVNVVVAPAANGQIDLRWLLVRLGAENVTHLLVEGGGEVNASFLMDQLAQRVVFFYAPKILGGSRAHKAVAGEGATQVSEMLNLRDLQWKRLGQDLLLTARIAGSQAE